MDRFVIFGVDHLYSAEILESALRLDAEIVAGVVLDEPKWGLGGVPCVVHPEEVGTELTRCRVVVPHLPPGMRKERVEGARELGFLRHGNIIDPTAILPSSLTLGSGIYVNAAAVIGTYVQLNDHVFVNRAASIGHHTRVETYGTIGPQVTIASSCAVGRGAFIGAGATIMPEKTVGANSVVGAGAVVIEDVPDNTVVVGNPARVVKEDIAGYADRSV